MIKAAQKEAAKKLGIDIDAIIAAHADTAEVDIVLPEGEIYTPDILAKRDKNNTDAGIKIGEKNSLSIAITEINKHTGLKLEAERFGDLGKLIKDNINASNDDKVKNLTNQVNALLTDKETLSADATKYKTQAEKIGFDYQQFKHLPANRSQNNTESEYLMLLGNRGVEIKADGIYRNGEPMTNEQTKGILPHNEAYTKLFTEFKWIAEPPAGAAGGRGGGNSVGGAVGKANSFSAAEKAWTEANPNGNIASVEFNNYVSAQAKDNPTFDYNN